MCLHEYMPYVYRYPCGVQCPGAGFTGKDRFPMWCWETNLAHLKDQEVFFIFEFSLQSPPCVLLSFSTSTTSSKKSQHE